MNGAKFKGGENVINLIFVAQCLEKKESDKRDSNYHACQTVYFHIMRY